MADGLAAAHAQGLVHRDVKPANILLERGVDRVVLTDFGLARTADDATLTCSGIVAGTPQYMSPEQARGDAVDARSDLFSLGSVLYTMGTGIPPFRAESPIAVLRRIVDDPPRPMRDANPRLPGWLDTIVSWLHAKSPDNRPASAGEVSLLLEQCLAHVQNPEAPLPRSLRKTFRFPMWRAALAAGLLLTAGALWIMRSWSTNTQTRAPVYRTFIQPEPLEWDSPVPKQLRSLEQDIESLRRSLEE
jgi:serine/threonine-protein kinase